MERKIIGELFGVTIHTPILRHEVRDVLKKQLEFKSILQLEQGLTEEQAFLEVADIFEPFFNGLSESERITFEKIHKEEMHAAPLEWFKGIGFSEELGNSAFLDAGTAGELYGVQVVYPFTRGNLRDVVQARSEAMKLISSTNNISLYQASNDLSDEQEQFIKRFNSEDQERFLTILTEEMIAHTNALNDETNRINQQNLEEEIANSNLTSTMAGIIVFCCLMFLFFVVFR